MEKHLSIVVPIHKASKESSISPLKTWTSEIDERCSLILTLDHKEEKDSLTEWCKKEMPSEAVIVHGEFGNPGQTRNNGLKRVSCQWLAFVDSDDYFDSSSAVDSIEHFDKSYDLIICNFLSISEINGRIFKGRNPRSLADLFPELGFWRILYKSEFVKDLEFPVFRMGEDQVFFSRVLSRGPKIAFSSRVIYNYVLSPSNQLSKVESSLSELGKSLEHMRIELLQSSQYLDFRKLVLFRQEMSYAFGTQKKSLRTSISLLKRLELSPKGIGLAIKCFKNLLLWYMKRKVF